MRIFTTIFLPVCCNPSGSNSPVTPCWQFVSNCRKFVAVRQNLLIVAPCWQTATFSWQLAAVRKISWKKKLVKKNLQKKKTWKKKTCKKTFIGKRKKEKRKKKKRKKEKRKKKKKEKRNFYFEKKKKGKRQKDWLKSAAWNWFRWWTHLNRCGWESNRNVGKKMDRNLLDADCRFLIECKKKCSDDLRQLFSSKNSQGSSFPGPRPEYKSVFVVVRHFD